MEDESSSHAASRPSKPRLEDVARLAGVSATTVSRVLNKRGYLSEDVKARVAAAIKELDYRPNEVARSLLGQRTRLVGLVVPSVADPFFGELAVAVEKALADAGYKMLLCDSGDDPAQEVQYLEMLHAHRVDGMITSTHNEGISLYEKSGTPVVAIDRHLPGDIPNISSDNLAGARMATELLADQGCRNILHITAKDHPGNARAQGYRQVLRERGLPARLFAYDFALTPEQRRQGIYSELERERPDGIFASDDISAMIALEWSAIKGLRVPEDLKIIGYDGTSMMRQIYPRLTTMIQPLQDMAGAAVELLLERMGATSDQAGQGNEGSAQGKDESSVQRIFSVRLHRGRSA